MIAWILLKIFGTIDESSYRNPNVTEEWTNPHPWALAKWK
jgi:hypothetical protein